MSWTAWKPCRSCWPWSRPAACRPRRAVCDCRSPRSVGRSLTWKRILADVTEAEHAASGEYTAPTGELVLTAPISLGRLHVVPMLADFFTAYPDIDVRLVLADRVVSLLEDQI